MQSHQAADFTPPYLHPKSLALRYFEWLMHATYENPQLTKKLIFLGGLLSCSLSASSLALSANDKMSNSAVASTALGLAGMVVSFGSWFVQNKIFGPPVDEKSVYTDSEFVYKDATAKLAVRDMMPILHIEAEDSYNAGFAEGFILGEAMRATLKQIDFLYQFVRPLIGAPKDDKALRPYLLSVLRMIPQQYQDEMQGKVAGYNHWLSQIAPQAKPLTLDRYLLLQLLPDISNYNPFQSRHIHLPAMSCTTIAFRLKNYTNIVRVLDWPAYGVAGKYFLQIDRKIKDRKRTVDMGFPLVSGALTVLNENGLLIEVNVAREAQKLKHPKGMPALFFNRYCAENAANITELGALITRDKGPLGAYHLTASDGMQTQSFHFYQSTLTPGEHAVETLAESKLSPELLVVANHGVVDKHGARSVFNYKDSDERKKNVVAFFKQDTITRVLSDYVHKQINEKALSSDDLIGIKNICLQIARLPLINNCESVFCAIYIFNSMEKNKIIDACATTDNGFAPKHTLAQFKPLMLLTSDTAEEKKDPKSDKTNHISFQSKREPVVTNRFFRVANVVLESFTSCFKHRR